MERTKYIKNCRRIVIKCGSAVLTNEQGLIDDKVIRNLSKDLADYFKNNYKITVVTSGAVASGIGVFQRQPKNIFEKQAFASVGQLYLMESYKKSFKKHGLNIAQILLTHEDFKDRKRYLHIKENIKTLINLKVIPIVNENDSVVVDEIKFGDNDTLSALYAALYEADLLIMLTDIDGFFDSNPKENKESKLITSIKKIDEDIKKLATKTTSKLGTGGMLSKLEAAEKATKLGIPVIIANGKVKGIISKILSGDLIGTFFYPQKKRLKSKKYWIFYTAKSRGKIIIDDGAVKAIKEKGKSLLPAGIIDVIGEFKEGDVVDCIDKNNKLIAKGISFYSSNDILKIKQHGSSDISEILGYKYSDEVIHRDNLVLK